MPSPTLPASILIGVAVLTTFAVAVAQDPAPLQKSSTAPIELHARPEQPLPGARVTLDGTTVLAGSSSTVTLIVTGPGGAAMKLTGKPSGTGTFSIAFDSTRQAGTYRVDATAPAGKGKAVVTFIVAGPTAVPAAVAKSADSLTAAVGIALQRVRVGLTGQPVSPGRSQALSRLETLEQQAGAAEKTLGTQDIGADTLEGAWDEVGLSFGQFLARKGKTAVQVDPLGARVGLDAVARIAAIALRRTGSPLSYDGAKAARSRKPEPASRNPCSLVTRQEAEGLMGRLKGDPVASADNSECEFALDAEMFGSPVTSSLGVEWRDGFHSLGQELLSTGMASKMMNQEMGGDIPALGTSSSDAQEPWAEMHVLLGGMVTVVKNDVLLRIPGTGFNGFDEEKAKALLRLAAGRL